MRPKTVIRVAAALAAAVVSGAMPGMMQPGMSQTGMAQTPGSATRTYAVELDAEKDYFAPDTVKIVAVSRGKGESEAGELDVTIRRRKSITVPGDTGELIFRTTKNISARLRLTEPTGKITVRPLGGSSAGGVGWMFGRRGGVTLEKLVVEFEK